MNNSRPGLAIGKKSIRFLICALSTAVIWAVPGKSIAQDLYVMNYNNGTVGEYNATTGATINASFITGLGLESGLALSGTVLYAETFNDTTGEDGVGEYNATTGATINASFISGINAVGLAISGGDLYVADGVGTVGEYDATTGDAIHASLITGLNGPVSLALSGSDLYVGCSEESGSDPGVGEYNATTGAAINASLLGITVPGIDPRGLAISGSNLFVANWVGSQGNNKVGEYNATTGATINASFITGLNTPYGLALSGTGLYVANEGSWSLGEYSETTGTAINTSLISYPGGQLDFPTSIAISPVPEPGTWALIAGGLGLLGGIQRFRRMRKA